MIERKSKMFAGADKFLFARAGELGKQQTFAEEPSLAIPKNKALRF
jgi:hypothetical protein